jgi:hypothetical protein
MLEEFTCRCGERRWRVAADPETACLACQSYDEIGRGTPISGLDFDTLVSQAGRIHGPALLYRAWNARAIDRETLTRHVGPIWSSAEYPDMALAWTDWRSMFDQAGYTSDGVPVERPSEPMKLYRAAAESDRLGHSWTENEQVARSFLKMRAPHQPQLWTALVEPSRMLARLERDRPGEPHYVVETTDLSLTLLQSRTDN